MPAQPHTSAKRFLLLAFLVLPLVGTLWFFDATSGPSKPSGRLGEAFEAELLAGLTAVGAANGANCSMVSKSSVIAVSCRTPHSSITAIADHFVSRGWTRERPSNVHAVSLKRLPDTLTVEAPDESETVVGIMRALP